MHERQSSLRGRGSSAQRFTGLFRKPLLATSLEGAVNNPDEENRLVMSEASVSAGRAISVTRTTACHALAYGTTALVLRTLVVDDRGL